MTLGVEGEGVEGEEEEEEGEEEEEEGEGACQRRHLFPGRVSRLSSFSQNQVQ